MQNPPLYAPWRMEYIRSLDQSGEEGCFLCQAAIADLPQQRNCLVVWTSEHCVAVMNRYPYANGHLLVAPKAHKGELEELSQAEQLDIQLQTTRAVGLLKRAVSAQGFNIGINLGRVAGAGVPGHLHQHIVPRWGGDTNFMSVVGETRIVPQAINQLYDELVNVLKSIQIV
ncbi:MAG: HIT domain-containing protein [Planctomycetota bacterium]|nr:HIT domain-containing protein [Planctomycetota bacterium]